MDAERILILGGAGYIGRSLIELYADTPGLTVVDRVFNPGVVSRLSRLGQHFAEGDIGDADLMRRLVVDGAPDIVYLLAGQIEAETSGERERLMWEENYEKPAAVMKLCQPNTRLFFPSSANVFGGNEDHADQVYTESCSPQPMYPYAQTKAAIEVLLAEWGGNYTVARLGTNYGWGPGIRFNLVANLFPKLALQGKLLAVHGDGSNYRPFVHNQDCARAIKFLSEHEDAEGELYHVVQGNYQINDVADITREVAGDTGLRHVAYRRGFASYQMSSAKLLELGFEFMWHMDSGIRDIVKHLKGLA